MLAVDLAVERDDPGAAAEQQPQYCLRLAAMTDTTQGGPATVARCPNCESDQVARYCASCGQKAGGLHIPISAVIHEALDNLGRQQEQLAKDGRGVLGRLRRWREDLEQRHRRERVALGKTHFEEARAIEHGAGEAYRSGMEGRRNGPTRRRGQAGEAAMFGTIPLSITGKSGASRIRSCCCWCGRLRERRLTRRDGGSGRGQASLWRPRGFRRTIGRSVVSRNAVDWSGTLAPAVERLSGPEPE